MLIKWDALRKSKDFRLLFWGQTVSFMGSMVTYTVIPYQIYEITKSSLQVGVISLVQLAATLVFGILGGSVADRVDRRRLLIFAELLMALSVGVLAWNGSRAEPSFWLIYIMTFLLQAANAYHRPAAEAMTQLMVSKEDFPSAAALGTLRYSVGAIVGPALGGMIIAWGGVGAAYLFDGVTFIFALVTAAMISQSFTVKRETKPPFFEDMKLGMRFARSHPVVLGSYLVDIIAMTFAFPVALFPEMAERWGGAESLGWLYAGMAIGSFVVSLFAGTTQRTPRTGRGLVIAAFLWAVFMAPLGYATSLALTVACLVLAGTADTYSGLYRRIIWNEAIPNEYRGRMAGLEMISYMAGPLLGNFRAGAMAKSWGVGASIAWGAGIGAVLVMAGAYFLFPELWQHRSTTTALES